MTQQVINRGTSPGDGTGEILYDAFGKVNGNFTELYQLIGTSLEGEYKTDGTLVYPYHTTQTTTDNPDGSLASLQTSYNSKTWTLTLTYTRGAITQMDSTDGTTNWTKTITYNADGSINNEGVWT